MCEDYLYIGKNSYQPSRFILRLDLPIDLHAENDEVFTDTYRMSLFVHEYIHFLQDISTRYGLMKASNFYMSTKVMAQTIRMRGEKSFKVPVKLEAKVTNEVIYQNYYVFFDYLGDGIVDEYRKKKIEVLGYRFENRYRHEVVFVKLNIEHVGIREVMLGGEILSESMAYLAEKNYIDAHHVPFIPPHEYPYLLSGKLAEFIYPEMGQDAYSLFLIIDQCLYRYFNPGPAFVQLIEYLKSINYCKKSKDDRFKCLDSFFQHNKPEIEDYNILIYEVIREVNDCFQDKLFGATIKWLYVLYTRCKELRVYPYFLKGFMDVNGLDSFAHQIYRFALGQPIVLNDIYEGIIQPPGNCFILAETLDIHPEYFSAIFSVRNIFQKGQEGWCLLKEFCTRSEKATRESMVDQYCDIPWLKYSVALADKKNICPFAVVWKHWGLTNQYPKK